MRAMTAAALVAASLLGHALASGSGADAAIDSAAGSGTAVADAHPHKCNLRGVWADNSERGFVLHQKGTALTIFETQFNSTVPGGVSSDCSTLWAAFSGTGNVTGTIDASRHNMTWSDNTPWFKRAPRVVTMNLTSYLDEACGTKLANYAFMSNECFTTPVGVSFMGQCTELTPSGGAWTWLVSAYPKPNCDGSGGGVSWYGGAGGQCGPMGYLGGMAATCSFTH